MRVLKVFADTLWDPTEVTREMAEDYIARYASSGGTKKGVIQALQSLYSYLEDREMVARSPVAKIQIRVKKKLPEHHSLDVIEKLFAAANEREHRRALAMQLCYLTGSRVDSLVNIRPEDIDLEDQSIHFRRAKGDKPYSVPLNEMGLQICRELLAMHDKKKGPHLLNISKRTFYVWCSEAGDAVGVHCHPHKLRHSFGTHLRQGGQELDVIQRLMNHSSVATTQIYAQIADEDPRKAIDGLFRRKA